MKIVVAMDSFKESVTALEACEAVKRGFMAADSSFEIKLIPMADGGEGTTQSLVNAMNGKIVNTTVTGPLGNKVNSFYAMADKTAIIEMAAASGLELVPQSERNPMKTTTKGTGELILHAVENGAQKVILGIGGSATNDGGAGMAEALGVRFIDQNNNVLDISGGNLSEIDKIDISQINPKLKDLTVHVACDVQNHLTGEKGAAMVFAPQKGANEEMVAILDKNLKHYATKLKQFTGYDTEFIPGAGAAGGLGAGCIAFLNTQLMSGIDIIIETINLENEIKTADLVITGEGKIDNQTACGKTIAGIAKIANKHNTPIIAIAGSVIYCNELSSMGLNAVFSVVPGIVSLNDALKNGAENIERFSFNLARTLSVFN